MSNIQVLAGASVGHVRACFSERCRGFAAPVDLMRAHLRAVNRCAVRRRVESAFSGYLVTDSGPDVLPLFSQHRGAHEYGILPECVTGAGGVGFFAGEWREGGGPIDAPGVLPAGSMRSAEFGGFSGVVQRWSELRRGGDLPVTLEEAEPAGVEVPVWRGRDGRVVWLGGGVYVNGLREEFGDCHTGYLLDASDFVPAGSTRRYVSGGEVCAARRDVMRAGWYE